MGSEYMSLFGRKLQKVQLPDDVSFANLDDCTNEINSGRQISFVGTIRYAHRHGDILDMVLEDDHEKEVFVCGRNAQDVSILINKRVRFDGVYVRTIMEGLVGYNDFELQFELQINMSTKIIVLMENTNQQYISRGRLLFVPTNYSCSEWEGTFTAMKSHHLHDEFGYDIVCRQSTDHLTNTIPFEKGKYYRLHHTKLRGSEVRTCTFTYITEDVATTLALKAKIQSVLKEFDGEETTIVDDFSELKRETIDAFNTIDVYVVLLEKSITRQGDFYHARASDKKGNVILIHFPFLEGLQLGGIPLHIRGYMEIKGTHVLMTAERLAIATEEKALEFSNIETLNLLNV